MVQKNQITAGLKNYLVGKKQYYQSMGIQTHSITILRYLYHITYSV